MELIALNKRGIFVYTETVKDKDFLIIIFMNKYSKKVDEIKMTRVRLHKSYLEE